MSARFSIVGFAWEATKAEALNNPKKDRSVIRLLLADGHSLFRQALKTVLDAEDDLTVVAEAADGNEAVALARQSSPDLALIGTNLPNCDSARVVSQIKEHVPSCRVLVVAAERNEKALLDAIQAGASAFLTKENPIDGLIEAAHAVHEGQTLVPSEMLGGLLTLLVRRRTEHDDALRRMSELTRRQREVLVLLARGADNDAIAQDLVISPQTARTHIQNILTRLGVHSRLEAASFAMRGGIAGELREARR